MRLHLVGFPHTQVSPEHLSCAYTQKVAKFARMMGARGHDVVVYATEGSRADGATETVELVSAKWRAETFGPDDPNRLASWPDHRQWELFNWRAVDAIRNRQETHRDIVLLSAGWSQAAIREQLGGTMMTMCEPGIGYEGVFEKFRAFESYAWMHFIYGLRQERSGQFYDAVIPNYFDPDELPAGAPSGSSPYLVFLGRLVERKGPHVAADIAARAGMPLYVAGPGATSSSDGEIVAPEVTIKGPVVHVGPVGVAERAGLLGNAAAIIAPTQYVEPFGGVAVEAMMCGTPAITTDWGAFTETVEEGVTGYRFRTLQEGADAVGRALELDRGRVRARAIERYSLAAVAPMYEAWLGRLDGIWDGGFYAGAAAA